ncbi:MAG: YtxH domain-containing protein [Caldilineaceae bacterium]|nr:YtxH domain-containing protein [Caldilineaceae bacterium]MBP8107645.1 YtxH domain-containing protein [Caldilineaceae bacterium]MBP8123246.1 YtxH domain-containing protein [Caldilineaceae bacterium]MBP9072755.1 YtxH domain-containing protein [Caldilineaceae bacterium]
MGKTSNLIIGTILGTAVGVLTAYLFAPAKETRFDPSYRSRLGYALDEGRKAAANREAELRQEFITAKQPRPKQA